MLDLIWNSGKMIFDWISYSKKNKKEINEEISIFLTSISDLLLDTSKKLAINEYPHDNCIQMDILKDQLISTLQGKMDDTNLQMLNTELSMATKLEKLYAEREDPETIKKLKECSGMFRALGMITKIQN